MGWRTIKRVLAAAAIVAMLGGGVSLASVLIFSDYGKPQQAAQQPTPKRSLPPPKPSVPTAKEFTINVVVTAQDCPPGEPCAYKYTIEPKYIGFHPLPETPFTVDYEVVGGNAPQPGSFTVAGSQAQILKDVVLEGPPGARLQANVIKVTDGPPPGEPPPGAPPGPPPPPPPG